MPSKEALIDRIINLVIARKLGHFFFEIFQVIIFAVSIFLFIYLLVVQPHKIKGESMMPNFINGEFLLTDKVAYRFGDPQRGDVIVFVPPGNDQDFIKRIIGLPGEEVVIRNEQVYINGNLLVENYLKSGDTTPPGKFASNGKSLKVPPGSYFVLGDNRHHSSDSRSFGFATQKSFSGRAWFVYWPFSMLGRLERPEYNIR